MKKAYSPVRLLETQVAHFEPGKPISLPVQNRFDHTTLDNCHTDGLTPPEATARLTQLLAHRWQPIEENA